MLNKKKVRDKLFTNQDYKYKNSELGVMLYYYGITVIFAFCIVGGLLV